MDKALLVMQRMIELQKQEEAERNLSEFTRQAWDIIEPGIPYLHNWHIDAMSEYLMACKKGQITRLLINMPPRYMKSIEVTVMFPAWVWIDEPTKRFINLSYSQTLSTNHSVARRNIIQSPWYQSRWPLKLSDDQNLKTRYQNEHKGFMFATSIGGMLTGDGGDYIIVDDPHNPQQAESDAERQTALNFFKMTLPTRLNDKRKGVMIVVMQRLHENDISGYVLEQGGWEHLNLQGIAEGRQKIIFPISKREIIREDGDLLWPEREGPKEIEQVKKDLGSYAFSGQYQQRPSPAEGGMFKRHWWRYWKPKGLSLPPVTMRLENGETINIEAVDLPDKFDRQLQSWDMTFKDTDGSDYVCGGVWQSYGADIFAVDAIHERMDFIDTIKAFEAMCKKWPKATTKLVEDKANGPAVIAMLRHKIGGIIAVEPEGSKQARAFAVTPLCESGNVYLPHPYVAPWTNELIEECAGFPNAAHDDYVDMVSQALKRFMYAREHDPTYELPYDLPEDLKQDLLSDPEAMKHWLRENGRL